MGKSVLRADRVWGRGPGQRFHLCEYSDFNSHVSLAWQEQEACFYTKSSYCFWCPSKFCSRLNSSPSHHIVKFNHFHQPADISDSSFFKNPHQNPETSLKLMLNWLFCWFICETDISCCLWRSLCLRSDSYGHTSWIRCPPGSGFMETFDLTWIFVKYRRVAVKYYSYLNCKLDTSPLRSGGRTLAITIVLDVNIYVYLAHYMNVCLLWMTHMRLVYVSICMCNMRVQQDYSETHKSSFSLDEDAHR